MTNIIIPRYDYPSQFGQSHRQVIGKISAALLAGTYILSDEVRYCEEQLAEQFGHKAVIGLNSGTDALLLTLLALNIGPGDEVIVPANTFYATAAAIVLAGATPRLVDIDERTFLTSDSLVLNAIGPRTKAVIIVHLYGKCVPLSALVPALHERKIAVIEDAAQAHGSLGIDGFGPGRFSDAVCYSFHPSKNLAAAGDAGAIGTDRDDIAEAVRILRGLGQKAPNEHIRIGYNSKLDAVQAIVLSSKLPLLAEWNSKRLWIANEYIKGMSDLPLRFQELGENERHVYHLFQVRTSQRNALLKFLRGNGIDAVIRYPTPIHLQQAFATLEYSKGDFPISEILANELLALPLFPSMTDRQIQYVISVVKKFFNK
jgi:dTDP-4-amino-4,6-dideoxygalactose transaminase